MDDLFAAQLGDCLKCLRTCECLFPLVAEAAQTVTACLRTGGAVAFCGNGGSASQAQHFAAELVGRFRRERRAFRAIALTTDSSILTAVGNDFCFEEVFSRQVEALLSEGDVLVGLSTSGNSRNVCRAFEIGRKLGLKLIAFTGGDGGRLASLADIELRVTASDAARIQEAHLFLGHLLCDVVEINLNQKRGS